MNFAGPIYKRNENENFCKATIFKFSHAIRNHDDCIHPNEMYGLKKMGSPKKFTDHKNSIWEWEQGKNNEQFQKTLDTFRDKNIPLVRETGTMRRQDNESLNSMITRTIPKNKYMKLELFKFTLYAFD